MRGFCRLIQKKSDFITYKYVAIFMLTYLQQLDASLLVAINGWHCPFADQLMWLISGKFSSALILITLLALSLRKGNWKKTLFLLIAIAIVVLIADRVSSGIIKPIVERLRPTHDPDLQNIVHVVNGYRGGLYGFVSSHAANLFGIATLISLVLRNRGSWLAMMAWAAIVAYSRIYLGVHYPGDILGGTVIGIGVAFFVFWIWKRLSKKWTIPAPDALLSQTDAKIINFAIVFNLLIIAIIAVFKSF